MGRGGLGLGDGDATADTSVVWDTTGAFGEVLVQPEKQIAAPKTKIKALNSKPKVYVCVIGVICGFLRRDSIQISISIAVGPTMNSA